MSTCFFFFFKKCVTKFTEHLQYKVENQRGNKMVLLGKIEVDNKQWTEDLRLNFSSSTLHDVASEISYKFSGWFLSVILFLISNILIFILTTSVEKTRVKLSGDANSDYINANHVKVVCLSMLQLGKKLLNNSWRKYREMNV